MCFVCQTPKPPSLQASKNWWDTMGGTCSEFRGQFADDVLDLSCPMPGGKGAWRAVWKAPAPGRLTFSMQTSEDGQTWAPSMDGTYRNGGAPARKTARKAAKKAAKKKAPKMMAKAAKRMPMKTAATKARRAGKAGKKAKRR